MKKVLFFLLILIVIQFFSPQKNNEKLTLQSFLRETNPPENIKNTLKNSCFDCHSNYTYYPWYNKITPINFWLASHVNNGKKHLNFSEWKKYNTNQKTYILNGIIKEVEHRKMPLKTYVLTHEDARLTKNKIDEIVTWAKRVKENN